jgi:mono/diheme cytochrome c family protein
MKVSSWLLPAGILLTAMQWSACSENKPAEPVKEATPAVEAKPNYGGYASQAEWGNHLVTIAGCNDCHTPKLMTPMGPVNDSSRLLSGHPENAPTPPVDRKQMEGKGLIVTADFTSWVGPWGISFTANLTPDETGTGSWKEEQFINAIRNKVLKGLPGTRPLLPPMAMMTFGAMTDDELKAIFAYTRTLKPVKNNVPPPAPPVLARKS